MNLDTAIFAGGCFWCMVQPFDTYPGIDKVESGYTGGHVANPTYEQVCSGTTGHTEAVKITFDPDKISYKDLVEIYWHQTDPTDASGQFQDRGDNYRPVIFVKNDEQRKTAEESKKALQESGRFGDAKIVTTIEDAQPFYPAEDYHQGFYFRLYHYPWMINYFYEVYQLTKDPQYVDYMDKAFEKFYQEGGQNFYPIGHHFSLWLPIIKEIKGKEASNRWKKWIEKHADQLISVGLNYPASEVNYEQSIVAPAVSVLLEAYTVTEKQAYLEEAKKHLAVLELFDGFQPDHHLNQVAIRHWDGYWFGKRKILGDTFPHYWSSLSGFAYLQYFQISGDKDYLKKAETSIRASLSLIRADGRGSCAYLYPFKINEEQGEFYDLLANDQDWALYYADQLQQILQEK